MGLIRCKNGHVFSETRYGTVCPYCNVETGKEESEEIDKNILYKEIEPVCGWLVCIKGNNVGKDYKIKSGKNFIGKADDMDIQILGDKFITDRNHAVVVYDSKKKNYVLLPGDSSGIAYINGEPAYIPIELSSYDVLELGKSRFIFVPFCNDDFGWEENV